MTEQPLEKETTLVVFDTQTLSPLSGDKPHMEVVAQTEHARVLLFSFRMGQGIDEHQTSHRITIQALQGRINFRITGHMVALQPGIVLTLEPKVIHSVMAQTDAVMLLTLL